MVTHLMLIAKMSKRKILSHFTPDDATEKSKKSCGMEMEKLRKSFSAPSMKTVKKWKKELAVQLKIKSALGSVDADQYQ